MSLTQRILIAMGLGLILGALLQWIALPQEHFVSAFVLNGFIDAGGKIFITLLKMLVVPLVFVSLVCGAASLGDTGSVGRLGGKTIGLYLLTTAIAVSMAMLIALTTDPGLGGESANQIQPATAYEPKTAPGVKDTLINVVPGNPIAAMADGKMLQVILFALLFGLALSKAGTSGQKLRSFFTDLNEVMMRLITMIIALTPIGVFCLMTQLGATLGLAEIAKVAIIDRHPLFVPKFLDQRERLLIIPLCRRQITAGLCEIAKVAKRHGLCPIILFGLGKGQHSVIGRLRRRQIAKPIVQVSAVIMRLFMIRAKVRDAGIGGQGAAGIIQIAYRAAPQIKRDQILQWPVFVVIDQPVKARRQCGVIGFSDKSIQKRLRLLRQIPTPAHDALGNLQRGS